MVNNMLILDMMFELHNKVDFIIIALLRLDRDYSYHDSNVSNLHICYIISQRIIFQFQVLM